MKQILEFLSRNFHFLVVKISIYLKRRVFVMLNTITYITKFIICMVKLVQQCVSDEVLFKLRVQADHGPAISFTNFLNK